MLDRAAGLLSTRDGVTVACEVEPADPVERLGAQALRGASIRVNDEIGDGTSTVVLIAGKLVQLGHKHLTAGFDATTYVQTLRDAVKDAPWVVLEHLCQSVRDTDQLSQIALQVTKGDREVANALAEASFLVGKTGMVVVEDGKGLGVEVVPKQGMEIDKGWESSDFSENGEPWKRDVVLVAVVDQVIREFDDVRPIMEAASTVGPGNLPLVVISQGLYGAALKTMVMNHRKDVLHCCGVRSPGYGPKQRGYLDDLATLTQATVIDPKAGMNLDSFDSGWLGSAQQVSIQADKATFVCFDDAYEGIERRVDVLRSERALSDSLHDREKITERIAKLTDGFCLLRVGAVTEAEAKERRARVEDALHAVRAALTDGVVPGAGMAYWRLADALEDSGDVALQALCEALREPCRLLASNAGSEPAVALQGLVGFHGWHGWDAISREIRDLRDEPLLADPLTVVRTVIETAVSVAATILTAEVTITRSR